MSHSPVRLRVYMMDLLATVPYYTAYLSRALLQHGVDVSVGSITYYLDLHCFDSRGLTLKPGCMDVVGRFPRLPRTLRRLLKVAETALNHGALGAKFLVRPPDVLHVQFLPMFLSRAPMDLWLMRLAQRRGARVVLTVHDLMPHNTADLHRAKFEDLYRSVDRLICHSDSIRARLQTEFGIANEQVDVIPHGPFFYDLPLADEDGVRKGYGIADGQQLVLWQGILSAYKGLDLLLEAWAAVEAEFAGATLVVVGTGSTELTDAVRAQVTRLGLHRVVLDLRFTSTEELVALYRAASVVVYPYRAITTSGALATGVALGKTIVASDLPVFRELLTNEEDALLVEPGDVEALGRAMLRVLQDAGLRERLAAAVRQKEFGSESWKSIAAQTEQVYVKACAAGSRERSAA
ncbi:glycosyltransferase family 4 protein [Terriglobus aquaticus]|uniref:Glycosyltransferase family 4 protein n=1 Tax=Terriglobus aquaticus TaxID=940139 RepID=A0ABW9KGL5_9BACT|nr:glycosyltransferase family 4 protein [Terriglobus aquaticus]